MATNQPNENDRQRTLDRLSQEVASLRDVEAIKQLKARYALASDPDNKLDDYAALFTDDAVIDAGELFGRYEGKEAIRRFILEARPWISWTFHYAVAPVIEVIDDRTAHGSWYWWELTTMQLSGRPDDRAVWLAATSRDEYRKENGAWKFSQLAVRFDMVSPYENGWVKTRFINL